MKIKTADVSMLLMIYSFLGLILCSFGDVNIIIGWLYIIGGIILFTLIFKSMIKTKKERHETEV